MRACLFGVWHTAEVLPVFEYIQQTHRTERPLFLAGFDIQPLATNRFRGDTGPPMVERQVAKSNRMFQLQLATSGSAGDIRDLGMADNLEFLLNERYPGKKLMVWAHNGHIRHTREARSDSAQPQRAIMGTWLAQRRRRELYTIGLYMYRGSAADNLRIPYPIRQAPTGSLESILHQAPWRYSFFDFSQAKRERGSEWMWSAIDAREMGTHPTRLVPRAAYDAVLFIDTAHPPSYR
jgi:erythromycin esterase-like protein